MKGQRLFIRPLEPGDRTDVLRLLGRDAAAGLIGKLVGNVVAVAATTDSGDALRLDALVVDPELRRKRIGRFMVDELVRHAATLGRDSVIVEEARDAAGFLRKVGFAQRGERWERRVR